MRVYQFYNSFSRRLDTILCHTSDKMITLVVFLIFICTIYWYGTRTFNYWRKRGVKHDKPIPYFGTNARAFLMQKSMTQIAVETYWKYPNERVVGFFRSTTPELLIRDPELIKQILQNDFSYFYYRGFLPPTSTVEPLMRNLFFLDGDMWRVLRQRMTVAFTSGKLKAMFPLIVERAERLQARALFNAAEGLPLDARDLMARYTIDFIGACGFGLDSDSLADDNSPFRKLGAKIFNISFEDALRAVAKEIFPEALKNVHYMKKVEKDIHSLVKNILKHRNYEPSGRNDFIDIMLECRKKGIMTGESLERVKPDGTPELAEVELTDELIAAQVFVFFAAGFETSSSATSYTLHQLAFHPHVQRKVHEEIDQVMQQYDNKLSYDAVRQMTYLSWCLKESLRMFPSLGFIYRKCSKKYNFKTLGFSIDRGVKIMIPSQALHMDPKYFPNPKEFKPERFDPEYFEKTANKYLYLPFGEGPRNCIGERLGEMQSLAGLAALLSRFSIEPASTTRRYPEINPRSNVTQSIIGGLPLIFKERKSTI